MENDKRTEEDKKNLFLEEFKREKEIANSLFNPQSSKHADEIVALLKTKELTYEEAYAVLQLAYRQLKYESNFLILKGDR